MREGDSQISRSKLGSTCTTGWYFSENDVETDEVGRDLGNAGDKILGVVVRKRFSRKYNKDIYI